MSLDPSQIKVPANETGDSLLTFETSTAKHVQAVTLVSDDGTRSKVVGIHEDNLDAFSRVPVSSPSGLFDAQFTYDLSPFLFEEVEAESGATVAHDATNRCALMTFASTPAGGKAFLQSYDWVRYQPGRAQAMFITFNFIESVADVVKFAGYSDGNNGIELQLTGDGLQLVLYSDTGNGNQTIAQDDWNQDTLDGLGPSGITLNTAKIQILVIDLQALYAGRVRVGFDIAGAIVWAHHFTHANEIDQPYIQTASLPVRCGMTCTDTASTTMEFICSSVSSLGGQDDISGYGFSAEGTATAGSGAATHILSVRPATVFPSGSSIANRIKFVPESVEVLVTGSSPVKWELVIGQAISGTTSFTAVQADHSGFEFNTAGTISGSPLLVIARGYCAASNQTKSSVERKLAVRYPITLNAAGAVRANGTISLNVTGLGGSSACRATLNWREVR